jgi:hypothetical protein
LRLGRARSSFAPCLRHGAPKNLGKLTRLTPPIVARGINRSCRAHLAGDKALQ